MSKCTLRCRGPMFNPPAPCKRFCFLSPTQQGWQCRLFVHIGSQGILDLITNSIKLVTTWRQGKESEMGGCLQNRGSS